MSVNDLLQEPEDIFTRFLSIFNKAQEENTAMKSLNTDTKATMLGKQEIARKLKLQKYNSNP